MDNPQNYGIPNLVPLPPITQRDLQPGASPNPYLRALNSPLAFPDEKSAQRFDNYNRYDLLQNGNHFEAWNIKLSNEMYRKFGMLRYVTANFAGLISKVIADMLFSDPVNFNFTDDRNQSFVDALVFQNRLHIQNYESALTNSARGDAVYKLRIGKRYASDDKPSIIIEDISPYIYFPDLETMDMRSCPSREVLAWFIKRKGARYVRKEIHTSGLIENQLWSYDEEKKQLVAQQPWAEFFDEKEEPEYVETRVKRNLIIHVPNWRKGNEYFGTSDYQDLETLFFALNNRITKVDNILDKHSDPILAIPEGVLDENGEVRKERLDVFEMPAESNGQKPEYIVWNANLESAFSEINKLVEFLFMFSEISPDSLGMGQGKADSGRALKLKMLRTIAKKQRKAMYYKQALQEVMTLAQELAIAWNVGSEMDGQIIPPPSTVETPEIDFGEGIPQDTLEMAQEEQIRLSTETTTRADSIMRLDGVDRDAAEDKVEEIDAEKETNLPAPQVNMQPMKNDNTPQEQEQENEKADNLA